MGAWGGCSSSRAEPTKSSREVSRSWNRHWPPLPRCKPEATSVSRETEVVFQQCSLLTTMAGPSLSALQRPSRVLHRSRGVMVAGPGVLGWGPAAPSLTCPHTPAQRRNAEGKGRFRPPPQVNPLLERWDALVRAHARFTKAAGTIPTSVSEAVTSEALRCHENRHHSHLGPSTFRRCLRTSAMTDDSVFTCFT